MVATSVHCKWHRAAKGPAAKLFPERRPALKSEMPGDGMYQLTHSKSTLAIMPLSS
jgi:hypothetical protein